MTQGPVVAVTRGRSCVNWHEPAICPENVSPILIVVIYSAVPASSIVGVNHVTPVELNAASVPFLTADHLSLFSHERVV